jgi:sortase A
MSDQHTPYIVRGAPSPAQYTSPSQYTKPGLHSHNANRRRGRIARTFSALHGIRLILFLVGIAALGYYGYTLSDQYVYQAYQNWAFDQGIAGRHVTFADFLRERTPFGFLVGSATATSTVVPNQQTATALPSPTAPSRPVNGAVLGRVEIARLNLSAVVREGVDNDVLSVAVGHVPSTALPGQAGNFAIAAHRDTLFRALKDIQQGDVVSFQSQNGNYTYKVVATKIVRPTDVSVLQPDGGGLIPETRLVSSDGQRNSLLTMITCYPFYYVGSAPKRFIVEAELVRDTGTAVSHRSQVTQIRQLPVGRLTGAQPRRHRKVAQEAQLQRGPHNAQGRPVLSHVSGKSGPNTNGRKHGFWHRVLHV